VVLCTVCGTAFADGIPAQSEFDRYYWELSKYEYELRGGKESEDDRHRLKILADLLQPIVPDRSSRILEIGCANGRLLSYLKEAGYGDVTGVDPSPGCARAAKQLYGVQVETGTVFDFRKPDTGFNFVVTLGVLEHIRDLQRAVRCIRDVTLKNGRVFVGVPDASNLIAEQDAPFQEFSTEHINFFSPKSLQYSMEAGGFRTISCASVNLELHCGVLTPSICGLFELSTEFRTEFAYDVTSKRGLVRYVSECEAMDKQLRNKIQQAVAGRSVIVWGVGTHTRRLLANDVLRHSDISAFIDSNPKYQGQALLGIPVLPPDGLADHREPILISSYAFQEEISAEIRDQLRLPNELILLYNKNKERVSHG
jgi:SAM-dependent methyltransferase